MKKNINYTISILLLLSVIIFPIDGLKKEFVYILIIVQLFFIIIYYFCKKWIFYEKMNKFANFYSLFFLFFNISQNIIYKIKFYFVETADMDSERKMDMSWIYILPLCFICSNLLSYFYFKKNQSNIVYILLLLLLLKQVILQN